MRDKLAKPDTSAAGDAAASNSSRTGATATSKQQILAPPSTQDSAKPDSHRHARRGHRHTVHAGAPEAPHAGMLAGHIRKGSAGNADADDRPCMAHLCTKCTNDTKEGSDRSKSATRPTYIMTSRSFQAGCTSPRRDSVFGPSSPAGPLPIFDRSRIVKQEVLVDGTSIGDYYDINIGSLGKGSYGSVIKAKEKRSGAIRAVKIVNKPKIENITRLKREIQIMKRLDHPNIIKLFEVYEDTKNLYLVLELCTGGELFDRIIKSGHFSERYAASLMKQVFNAIAYCHSNDVMHRDLKPENLLYADASPLSALKVIDWGFAARCPNNHKFSSVVGTPYYVAPEVLFGNYDKNCDIWSAGVVLYILLCGYPPFHGKDNQEILRKVKMGEYTFDPRHWKRVSEKAKALIRQMLMYDPRRRISAASAQQHEWILHYTQPVPSVENTLSSKLGSDLMEKFKAFQRFNKMKKLAITCVAYQLSESEIGRLHEIFHALDKNGDGVLTASEIAHGMENMQVRYGDDIKDLLGELDTDASGTIDYTEFIAASMDHK
eukprot:Selendium_serpulae@DN6395_c1_g1_i3.p1